MFAMAVWLEHGAFGSKTGFGDDDDGELQGDSEHTKRSRNDTGDDVILMSSNIDVDGGLEKHGLMPSK